MALMGGIVPAQGQGEKIRTTIVNVELLSGADGGALHAQAWLKIFEKQDVSLVIRRGFGDDKPEVSEKIVGTLRYVKVVGRLGRNGELEFPGHRYDRGDVAPLTEWMNELKTYGMQGAPAGKPLWGLSKPQFEDLYNSLTTVVNAELTGLTLPAAIEQLKLPTKYPLRWSTAAESQFKSLGLENTVRQEIRGFTQATTLAILLNDRGFSYRPQRTAAGSIELVVEIRADDPQDRWPVGWPVQKQVALLLPAMFAMTTVDVPDLPALDVFKGATLATKTPVLVNYSGMDRAKIDLSKLNLSFILKRTTWSLALRSMLVPNKLLPQYWQDEAGRGFVWVTPVGLSHEDRVKE